MSVPNEAFEELAQSLADDIVSAIKTAFQDKWETVSAEHRNAIRTICARYATVILLERAGYDISNRIQILEASIANFKAGASILLYDAVMEGLTKTVSLFGTFVGKVAKSVLS